jgi:hypothetical protein
MVALVLFVVPPTAVPVPRQAAAAQLTFPPEFNAGVFKEGLAKFRQTAEGQQEEKLAADEAAGGVTIVIEMFNSDDAYGDTTVLERDPKTHKPTKKRIRFDKSGPGDANNVADTIKHELRHLEIFDSIGTAGTHVGVDDGSDGPLKKFGEELKGVTGTVGSAVPTGTATPGTGKVTPTAGAGGVVTSPTPKKTTSPTPSHSPTPTPTPSHTPSQSPTPTPSEPTTPPPTTAPASYTLTVVVYGGGRVNSQPAGINCPGTCSMSYAPGTGVLLTALPQTGLFVGWGGDCSTSVPVCQLTISSSKTVIANFQ